MDRRAFLKAAAITGLALNPIAARAMEAAKPKERPNFVFILLDDLRYDLVHCTGNPKSVTPNIDRIARNGTIFSNAFVTISLCAPSRATFLTGQYGHCNGVYVNETRPELDPAIPTWPRLLQEAGYDTAFVGKWHQGKGNYARKGFNHWVSFDGQGVYDNPVINIDGEVKQRDGYMSDILNDAAMTWLRKDRKQPFCLYLAHKGLHGPFKPAARHEDLYEGVKFPHPPNCWDDFEGKPQWLKDMVNAKKVDYPKGDRAGLDQVIRKQLQCLASIDEGVGRILGHLEREGLLENTVVAFAGDNGFYHGEHNLGDKRSAYEESIRIPLIVSYPKMIKPGTKIEDMVLNTDVAPTMLDLAGVKAPDVMQGKSMAPLFSGDNAGWRREFFYEYIKEPQFPRIASTIAVRTERWKYIRYPEVNDIEELYDLENDRYELKNLAYDPRYAATLADMKKRMDKLMIETKAKEFWEKRIAAAKAS